MTQEINILALVKGDQRYIFLYDDNRRAQTLRTLGRYASNPELNFSWYDAAVLSQKIRHEEEASTPDNDRLPFLNHDDHNDYDNWREAG